MTNNKPYLDQQLTLNSFAEQLNSSPSAVSSIINHEFHSSFSDFVNRYRVEEAKRLLRHSGYQHFKVEAIGLEAGFKNKVNFNRVFKKFTGTTPSQLRPQQQ